MARGPWRHGGLCGGVERLWWRGRDFSGGCGGRWRATGLAAFLAPAALSHVVGFAVLSLDGAGSGCGSVLRRGDGSLRGGGPRSPPCLD
jgi:hypothetical protein